MSQNKIRKGRLNNDSQAVLILSTAAPEQASGIAQALVKERLVACVNILPVQSVYRWKGEDCNDSEHLMIMKTTKAKADEAVAAVRKLHSYELPEIIVLPVIAGYVPYLDWVAQEVSDQ